MGSTPAIGNGPFEFTDAQGKQWSIPLTAINFTGNQYVLDPAWVTRLNQKPAENAAAIASVFLTYAVNEGNIAPAPAASPFPAMVIQAASPGVGGNNIQVKVAISNPVTSPPTDDPTKTLISLTVTETDTYESLTAATIQSQLSPGGLIQAQSVDIWGSPLAMSGSLSISGSPASAAQLDVYGSGSPSLIFTLVAKGAGADGALTQVTITPNTSSSPSSGTGTFKLVASWTKPVNGITLLTLEEMVASYLNYEITISKPNSGAYSVPAAGLATTLIGGAPGANASATLFTGQ